MKPLPLTRIAQWTNGRQIDGCDVLIDAVETDTRTLDASDGRAALFIALKGANFDGHDHVAAAAELGARAALVSREVDVPLPQVVVADTEHALGAIAAALHRGCGGKVVGITGSNGKTTVKQLTHAILRLAGKAYANPGNRNNEIGLPLAVIDAPDDADYAVYEMGAGKQATSPTSPRSCARTWRWSTTSRPRTWSGCRACTASPRPRARSTRRCRSMASR